ncbi:MAG: trypsin-like serine protease [Tepidisphaeraceae bacterium]
MRKLAVMLTLGGVGAMYASPAVAGTIRHDRDHIPYLQLGSQVPATGSVFITVDIFGVQDGQTLASGVLIDPHWILTAAHVVDGYEENADLISGVGFVPAQDPVTAIPFLPHPTAPFHDIDLMISHPNWGGTSDPNSLTEGFDLALMRLATPVTNIVPVTRYTGAGEVGNVGTWSGHGMRGDGHTGMIFSDELRRAGHNMIDMTGGSGAFAGFSPNILLGDFDNPEDPLASSMGSSDALDLEYSIASGDSGGAVYVDFPDDGLGPVLVGINSFNGAYGPGDPFPGDNEPNAQYGEFFGATRVAAFNDWINETMAANMVPEPSAMAVVAMLAAPLVLRRRQRRSPGSAAL